MLDDAIREAMDEENELNGDNDAAEVLAEEQAHGERRMSLADELAALESSDEEADAAPGDEEQDEAIEEEAAAEEEPELEPKAEVAADNAEVKEESPLEMPPSGDNAAPAKGGCCSGRDGEDSCVVM